MLSISRTPEMRAMEKVNAHQRQEDAYRAGRPRKYSPADNRLLLRQLRKARDQTAEEVQHEAFGLWATGHASTVRRLFREHGYHKAKARPAPALTYMQKLRRRKWATEFKHCDWSTVLFTDEKKWNIRPDGPKMVWRRQGESHDERCVKATTKYGQGSIMVWGAISATKAYPLTRVTAAL